MILHSTTMVETKNANSMREENRPWLFVRMNRQRPKRVDDQTIVRNGPTMEVMHSGESGREWKVAPQPPAM